MALTATTPISTDVISRIPKTHNYKGELERVIVFSWEKVKKSKEIIKYFLHYPQGKKQAMG